MPKQKWRNSQVTISFAFYQLKKCFLLLKLDLIFLLPFSADNKDLLNENSCLEEKIFVMEETMANAEAKVKELSGDIFFRFRYLQE